jgi:hypothetical protein
MVNASYSRDTGKHVVGVQSLSNCSTRAARPQYLGSTAPDDGLGFRIPRKHRA